MSRSQSGRSEGVRGLISCVGVLALVVGFPLLLGLAVGWPLPHGVPSWTEFSQAVRDGYIPDRLGVGAVAVVGWLAWFQLAGAVLTELVAVARHRPSRRVRLFVAPARHLAARWVGSAVMVGMLFAPKVAMAAPAPPVPVAAQVATSMPADGTTLEAEAPQPSAAGVLYVVQPWEANRDCLWTIAERYLGDGMRWREIFKLNQGRPQADGRVLANPDFIIDGWHLLLPADATGVPAEYLVHPVAPPAAVDPAPDSSVAADPVEADAAEAAEVAETAAPTPVAGETVGEGIPVPAPMTAEVTEPEEDRAATSAAVLGDAAAGLPLPADATVPAVGVPDSAETSDVDPAEPAAEADGGGGLHVNGPTLLGAGLLAAGVVAMLDRMRRAQQRRRRPGHRIALPGPEAAGREWAARAGADDDAAAWLDLGLRALVQGLRDAGMDPPEIVGVELGDGQLEVILASEATPAPAGFRVKDKGRRWVLARPGGLTAAAEAGGIPDPLPGLVTLGHTVAGSQILVDLEETGLVAIAGDVDVAREIVVAAAVGLANKGDSSLFHLILVGFGEGLDGLERVQVVDSLEEVIEYLESEAVDMHQALEVDLGSAEAWTSTLDARVGTGLADSWAPTLVLCSAPPAAELAERLVQLTTLADYDGVGVMVAGEVEAAPWQLVVGEVLAVAPLGLQLEPQRLSAEEAAAIGELYDVGRRDDVAVDESEDDAVDGPVAEDLSKESWDDWDQQDHDWDQQDHDVVGDVDELEDPEASERLAAGNGHRSGYDADAADDYELEGVADEDYELEGPNEAPAGRRVLVRVLGPVQVEVDGVAVKFERPKAKEAIAYLATHRDTIVTGDRLAEILWPGRPPKTSTNSLNTTTHAARRALGKGPGGAEYLPRLRGAQREYGLDPVLVGLDYDDLAEARKRARSQAPEDAIATLKEALAVVRGEPFAHSGKGYEWAHADGQIYEMAAEVADAAHELAGLCMAAGDVEGARRAVSQGHRASPGNETLYQDKMLAAGSSSGRAGVEAVMAELSQVADEQAPYAELDPETVLIYEQLTRAAS